MTKILCIDIGGTRIKAATLNNNMTIKKLKNTNVKVMETLGWMNESLPKIICKNHSASLIYEGESFGHYDFISIGVPLKVLDNGKSIEGHYNIYGVPKNLLEAFKDESNCEIVITNDCIAWMHGALKYFQLCSIEMEFPCLSIILGTGVGLAYSDSYTNIKGFEISDHNDFFKNLSNLLNEDIYKGTRIHNIFGEKFFRSVKDLHRSWSYLKIQDEYTERLICLLKDIEEAGLYNYKDVKSIIIGGGNSKYVDSSQLKCSLDKSFYMLNKNHLQINPDLISLLGLVSLTNSSLPK